MTRWLETDTLSNQDISTGLAIGAYTADADRLVLVQWFCDQASGNGDYTFYVTHQIGGSGSSYRYIPITTAAAASGLTAIGGQSGMIAVRSGDVLTVYLDGLAGDTTTPDTIVRWFELAALQPATPGRTLAVDEDGRAAADVTAISGDTTAADNLEAVLDGTGGVTLTIKKLTINNTDPTGVGIQVNAYNAANIVGTNRGVMLQGGGNQALYMLSDTAAATLYIEGPSTGGKGIAISSPSDGSSLPGASGIYIQTESGHPGILFDFTDPADALKVANSDQGAWVLDDKLFAMPADTADAVRTELATELARIDAAVSTRLASAGYTAPPSAATIASTVDATLTAAHDAGSWAGGGTGLTAQETRDALKLAPSAGAAAAGSIDAELDAILAAAQSGIGTGSGALTYTYTLTSGIDAAPIAGADVWVSTNLVGTNIVARGVTDAFGQVVFYLDAGTYYFWRQLAGWTFGNPDTEVVA